MGRPQTREWDTCIHPRALHTARSVFGRSTPALSKPQAPKPHGSEPTWGLRPGCGPRTWRFAAQGPTRCWHSCSPKAWEQDGHGDGLGLARRTHPSSPSCHVGLQRIREGPPHRAGRSAGPACESMQGTPHGLCGIMGKLRPAPTVSSQVDTRLPLSSLPYVRGQLPTSAPSQTLSDGREPLTRWTA